MDKKLKLLKCKKCGHNGKGWGWQIHDPEYWVSCEKCDASTDSYRTPSFAAEAWNEMNGGK